MKVYEHPTKVVDEVMTEVRAIKRGISERHGNDIDRLLASLTKQERAAGTTKAEVMDVNRPVAAEPRTKSP